MNVPKSIWIGVAILVVLTVVNALVGYYEYGKQTFEPNFLGAMVGACLGAALALITVVISFVLQQRSRSIALNVARFLFLRKEGERLKEAYIRYADTLRLGGNASVTLAGTSWQALKREYWPDLQTISEVQSSINNTPLSGSFNASAVKQAYEELRQSIEKVVYMSVTVFEGKENLIKSVLWNTDFKVNSLSAKLLPLVQGGSQAIDLTPIQTPVKEAGISSGDLLITLCKLAGEVKLGL